MKSNSKIGELVPQIFAKYSTLKSKKTKETEGVDDGKKKILETIFKSSFFKSFKFYTEWDSITNAMLTLLKLLPSFRKSINKKQKTTTTTTVQTKGDNIFEKLIVFVKSNNAIEQPKVISELPILIAVGPVKKTILQYFLKIDGQLLPTKNNCTSIEAFDYLYKAHTVFDCSYDWELRTFYDFIQYFIYEEKEGIALTTRQKEIWKLISV